MLIEIKLVINNAPIRYVYPNTCLTPNNLLFAGQLLHYSNTTSQVVRNLTVLSSTIDKINRISNHFWDRWRRHVCSKLTCETRNIKIKYKPQKNMLCYFMMKRCPQNFWRIGIVRVVLSSRDSAIKGAIVRIKKTNAILERHVNKLFPIE